MRPNFWTVGAGAIVASLFLFEAHRSPAVHVMPVPVVPAPAEQSPLEKGVHALPKKLRRGFVPPVVRTEPSQAPAASATGPSSELSQPAVSVVPCNSLSCAMRHETLEPSWAVLTRTPGRSRAVRTGYAYRSPAYRTYLRHRAAGAPRHVRLMRTSLGRAVAPQVVG